MVVDDENKKSISSNFLIYSGFVMANLQIIKVNLSKFLKDLN